MPRGFLRLIASRVPVRGEAETQPQPCSCYGEGEADRLSTAKQGHHTTHATRHEPGGPAPWLPEPGPCPAFAPHTCIQGLGARVGPGHRPR